MSSAAGGRPFCQLDLCGKYLQGGASPSLFNGLVGSRDSLFFATPSPLIPMRYQFS